MDFRGIAKVTRTFEIRLGTFRARGLPAVLTAVSGLVLAAGTVRALNRNAGVLPEVFREAKALVDALRSERGPERLGS